MKVLRQFTDGKGRMNMPGDPAHDDYEAKVKQKYIDKEWIGAGGEAGQDKQPAPEKAKAGPNEPKKKKPVAPAETKPDAPDESK